MQDLRRHYKEIKMIYNLKQDLNFKLIDKLIQTTIFSNRNKINLSNLINKYLEKNAMYNMQKYLSMEKLIKIYNNNKKYKNLLIKKYFII